MICPKCKIDLEKAIFYNVEVDYCPQCLGVFFEEDELRQVKDERDRNLAWLDVDLWHDEKKFKISYGIRSCPNCRLLLYEVYYGNSKVIVDVCNICHGVWLDRGEFKKIIEYLKKEADWQILNNFGKVFLEEFWEIFTGPETLREEILDFLIVLKFLNYKLLAKYDYIKNIIFILPK